MIKRKRTFVILLCIVEGVFLGKAMNIEKLWLTMPDSLFPYLSRNQRIELIDYVHMGVSPDVVNIFGDTTRIDIISNSFMQVFLSRDINVQIRLLPTDSLSDSDSIVCLLTTVYSPEPESRITFYRQTWEQCGATRFFNNNSLIASLTARPDSMSDEQYKNILSLIEPRMVWATFSPVEDAIYVSLSTPLLDSQGKHDTEKVIMQRKLKWNGRIFK